MIPSDPTEPHAFNYTEDIMATLEINGDEFDIPFIDLLPPLADEERAGLEADIRANGVLQPIIYARHAGRFVLIDGHNRAGIASELGVRVPVCEHHYPTFDAMKAHALELNLHRRHLTPDQLRALRSERIQRVAAARGEGQSLATIAEAEGVSRERVRQDIRAATVKGLTVEPEKVKGRDGRTRKAKPVRKSDTTVPPDTVEPPAPESGPDPVAEYAERLRLLVLLLAQERADQGRVRDHIWGIRFVAGELERELDGVEPEPVIIPGGGSAFPLPYD